MVYSNDKIMYEILFIFVAGCVGDMIIHVLQKMTKNTRFPFAQSLEPYYKSLEIGTTKLYKVLSSYIIGAFWGGIACVFALLLMKLFIFAMESTNKLVTEV